MAYKATHRFARISARKVRPLADLIRGKHADEALDILQVPAAPRRAAAGEGAQERPGQRRGSPGARTCSDLVVVDVPRRRRADVQAHPPAGPRHGVHDQASGWRTFAWRWMRSDVTSPRRARLEIRQALRELLMGQKVNPVGFRTGIMDGWKSRWYASKQEFSRPAGRGPQDPQVHQGEVQVRRHPQDRDRADPRRGEGHPAHRPAGHHHRPQGAGGRAAAGRVAGPDRPADQHQDRGNHPARDPRPAGGRGHRRAAGQAGQLPPHDEAGDRQTMEAGAKGIKIQLAGRLGGSEMARREKPIAGSHPAVDAAGEDRLRLHRSQDRHRATSASRCGSTTACTRGRNRWR